jgi:hypothetical protein
MKKLFCLSIFVFCSLFVASLVSAQCQGNVYLTSLTWQTANSVQSYSSTELDYCAGLYYDPAVSGNLTEGYGTGSALIGQGYTQGYADSIPARLDFGYAAPINNLSYTTNGDHYVIAYYLVYVPYWNDYYWYDPWNLGFGEIGGGYEIAPDYFGYFSYVTYWVASPQYVGSTSQTLNYSGQTQCLAGQQFTTTGQPCSSIPECQSGQQFTTTGQTCPNYVPPPQPPAQPVVSVRFFDDPLKPAGTTVGSDKKNTQVETCITGVSNPTGQTVNLNLVNESFYLNTDGGHKEDYHKGKGTTKIPRPLGFLGSKTGITGADGCYRTNYTPPGFSGIYTVVSTISGYSNKANIGVAVPNLQRLFPGENYRLVGGGPEDCNVQTSSLFPHDCEPNKFNLAHPSNHWAEWGAITNLPKIANAYKAQYYANIPIPPSEMVQYNDFSLEWGGKFDLNTAWLTSGAHDKHRTGNNGLDTRSLNIPSSRHEQLMIIFNQWNFGIHDERFTKNPHWHLKWNDLQYTKARSGLTPTPNGIEPNVADFDDEARTTSTLTNNIGEAIFERLVTQEEFEAWHPSLKNAKQQGLNTFLQQVKTFEKSLFASQEYVARQRTNEQFVQDVFASHLFREPGEQELSYWVGYLSDIGGTQQIEPTDTENRRSRTTIPISQTQRRQIFLDTFQNLPDFVKIVEGVVEDTYQEPPH